MPGIAQNVAESSVIVRARFLEKTDTGRHQGGRLKVAADGLNMSLRPGAKWELVIDPDAEYMVRSAELDYRNRRSSYTNSGLKRHGSRCVPEKAECKGKYMDASFEIQSASSEADTEFLKNAKDTMRPPYLIHTDVSDQRVTPRLHISYDARKVSPNGSIKDWDIGLEDPKQPATTWGEEVNGLRAAVEFVPEKKSYSLGERVGVRFHIQNVSKHDIQIASSGWRQEHRIFVQDDEGKEISVRSGWFSGDAGIVRYILKPRETVVLESSGLGFGDAASKMDINTKPLTSNFIRCGPDRYFVHYKLKLPDITRKDGDGKVIVPQPDDWQGVLDTGKRKLVLTSTVESDQKSKFLLYPWPLSSRESLYLS